MAMLISTAATAAPAAKLITVLLQRASGEMRDDARS